MTGLVGSTVATIAAACTSQRPPLPSDNDTALLRQLMEDARDNKRPVQLERGRSYDLTGSLNVSDCTVIGNGAIVRCIGGSQAATGWLTGSGSIDLRNLTLIPEQDRVGTGIYLVQSAGSSVRLKNVHLHGFKRVGFKFEGENSNEGKITLIDLRARGCGIGLLAVGVTGLSMRKCTFVGQREAGAMFKASRDLEIAQCTSNTNGSHGLVLMYSDSVIVKGGVFNRNGRGGLTIGGGDPTKPVASNIQLSNNQCDHNELNGISVDVTRKGSPGVPLPTHALIEKNTCEGNGSHGINVTCSSDVTIRGNTSQRNRLAGVAVASSDVSVEDNRLVGNGTYGVAFFGGPARPAYGRHRASGNIAEGNGSGTYLAQSEVEYG